MEKIFKKLSCFFVKKWQIAVLDMDRGRWCVEPNPKHIKYLKAENAKGRHILMQPMPEIAQYYLLIDDINWSIIKHHCNPDKTWKKGRLVIETSPGNYQVWIHSSNVMSIDNKRYWLKRLRSDPGAAPKNRWGRCPGFRNRKAKYCSSEGGYPLAKLIWVDWKYQVTVPQVKSDQKLVKKICRSDYYYGDNSSADLSYAIALLRLGNSEYEVKKAILKERCNWNNHKGIKRIEEYLLRTVRRAKELCED
jgi:hypothetical protein